MVICARLGAAHGLDLGNGRPGVQRLSAEAGRVRAHVPHARSKGKKNTPSFLLALHCRKVDIGACA
jgi:hypothetical protein